MIIFSFICAVIKGNSAELSTAVINSGNTAVNLGLSLLGTFCLWNGLMAVAEKSGITNALGKLMAPLLCKIFKGLKKDDEALTPISLNITSNLLGLSNAATPLGIEAMKRLAEKNQNKETADNNMILFVVMNSAALRLIPTTVGAIRTAHGSENPMEIIVPSVLCSICSLTVGISLAKALNKAKLPDIKSRLARIFHK